MTNLNPNTIQVGGEHYKSVYQHWDFALDTRQGYLEAQVTKYVARWRKKNGLQDLQKASHFLDKLVWAAGIPGKLTIYPVNRFSPDETTINMAAAAQATRDFTTQNNLSPDETLIMSLIVCSLVERDEDKLVVLGLVRKHLDNLLAEATEGAAYTNQDR